MSTILDCTDLDYKTRGQATSSLWTQWPSFPTEPCYEDPCLSPPKKGGSLLLTPFEQKTEILFCIFYYCNRLSLNSKVELTIIDCLTVSIDVRSRYSIGQLGSWLGSHKAQVKVLAGLHFLWRLWRRIHFHPLSGCWQNSIPRGQSTEVSASLLTVSWGLPLALKGLSSPCTWHLCLRARNSPSNPSCAWNLSAFPFHLQHLRAHIITLDSLRKSPYFKVNWLVTLVISAKPILLINVT